MFEFIFKLLVGYGDFLFSERFLDFSFVKAITSAAGFFVDVVEISVDVF